jgi:predicted nucleic acid-binding protein
MNTASSCNGSGGKPAAGSMDQSVFLDACVFYDCLEHPRCKQILDRAHNLGFKICTSITVLGEALITMLRRDDADDHIAAFVSLLKEWDILFVVPSDGVRIIRYELGEDYTDTRMLGQATDRTHLAYAMAYGFKHFISTDQVIRTYSLPRKVLDMGFKKTEVYDLIEFRNDVLNRR